MKCPRCHSEVPDEASKCADCKLPKLRGFSAQNEAAEHKSKALAKKARDWTNSDRSKQEKQRPKWVAPAAGAAVVLLLSGLGFYLYLFFSSMPQEVDPTAALPMLDKLRNSPSSQEGLNVDDLLAQRLERSRRVGNLLSYQGWSIKPVNGSKTKLLISFSFQESDDTQQRAEWLADLVHNTFTPQTELAVAVYRK